MINLMFEKQCSNDQLQENCGDAVAGRDGRPDDCHVNRPLQPKNKSMLRPLARSDGDVSESQNVPRPHKNYRNDSESSRGVPNKILLVHGLEHMSVNCDMVFNLFCLYGNISMVKILKDNKILVALEDVKAAKRCVSKLHMLPLDESHKIKVKYSKLPFIRNEFMSNLLKDGTPAHKVYVSSKLNRFTETAMCQNKLRIAGPSKILHFFNAPTDLCGLTIYKTVTETIGYAGAINSITFLPKSPAAKCSTGLIEFKNLPLAVKAIMSANHLMFESSKSRFPFLTKLCFSKWFDVQEIPNETPIAAVNGQSCSSPTTLRCRSTAPFTPWLLHESEHMVNCTQLPVAWSTVVATIDDSGDGHPWILRAVQRKTKYTVTTADPAEPKTGGGGGGSGSHGGCSSAAEEEQQQMTLETDVLNMLRWRLCGCDGTATNKDDQGDVLRNVPHQTEFNFVPFQGGGPLGDA